MDCRARLAWPLPYNVRQSALALHQQKLFVKRAKRMEMCVRHGKASITFRVIAANRILQLDMRNGGRVDCVDCITWGSIFIGLRVDCMPRIVSFGAEYSWPLTTEAATIRHSYPYSLLHVSSRSKAFLTHNEVICRHTFYDCTKVHVQFESNL